MAELEDTLRETGVSAMGSTSPSKVQPQDIDRAFSAADRVDPGSSMPEAGQMPVHNKIAFLGYEVQTVGDRPVLMRQGARDRVDAAALPLVQAMTPEQQTRLREHITAARQRLVPPPKPAYFEVTPLGTAAGAAGGALLGHALRRAGRGGPNMGAGFGAFAGGTAGVAVDAVRDFMARRENAKARGAYIGNNLAYDALDRALAQGKTAALRDLGLLKLAEGLAGSAPIPSPTSVKPPKSSTKISPTYDTRTDKPPGYNLTHGVQTMSNGADVNDSYGAFGRRLQGSPV